MSETDRARTEVAALAARARTASYALATAPRAVKDAALHAMADALQAAEDTIVAANHRDVERAVAEGVTEAVVDRLRLDPARVTAMASGLRDLAGLPDPVGEVVRGSSMADGLEMRQVRVPFGVVGMVYEGRPNVTADAAGICLKAGSAVLLRGSSSALQTNRAVVEVFRDALASTDVPPDAVALVEGGHDSVEALMAARGQVDLLIPRGGAGLIQRIVTGSSVPVIETGVGNCHVYVDAAADLEMAERIVLNAKTQRTSVCNAAETVLVHADIADAAWARLVPALEKAGVTVHGDKRAQAVSGGVRPATDEDYATEYLGMQIAAGTVDSLEAAVDHIRRFGTGHTEAIVTGSVDAARRFTAQVDAAAVVVNASTRFTDGGEFGFGAEIGISTQKLHARGPMGLTEMTSTTYVVTGDGQIRQ